MLVWQIRIYTLMLAIAFGYVGGNFLVVEVCLKITS
jgi:hypothetical protein